MKQRCKHCGRTIAQYPLAAIPGGGSTLGPWVHLHNSEVSCGREAEPAKTASCWLCGAPAIPTPMRLCVRCEQGYNWLTTMPDAVVSKAIQYAIDHGELKLRLHWRNDGLPSDSFEHGTIISDYLKQTITFEFGR